MFTTTLLGGMINLVKAPKPLEISERQMLSMIGGIRRILHESDNTAGTLVSHDHIDKIIRDIQIFFNYSKYKEILLTEEQRVIENFFACCECEAGFLLKDADVREILTLIKEELNLEMESN